MKEQSGKGTVRTPLFINTPPSSRWADPTHRVVTRDATNGKKKKTKTHTHTQSDGRKDDRPIHGGILVGEGCRPFISPAVLYLPLSGQLLAHRPPSSRSLHRSPPSPSHLTNPPVTLPPTTSPFHQVFNIKFDLGFFLIFKRVCFSKEKIGGITVFFFLSFQLERDGCICGGGCLPFDVLCRPSQQPSSMDKCSRFT